VIFPLPWLCFYVGSICLFFQTFAAYAGKADYMALYPAVEIFCSDTVDLVNTVHIKVYDTAAFPAVEMVMRRNIRIKMVCAVADFYFLDLSDRSKQLKVAVYGPQTDAGVFLSYICVDKISSRVVFTCGKKIVDSLTLPAVFKFWHKSPSAAKAAE
jgi:hypothetical protein